jgi:hypothetical protein
MYVQTDTHTHGSGNQCIILIANVPKTDLMSGQLTKTRKLFSER